MNTSIGGGLGFDSLNETQHTDPDAAPLEQNVKNLMADGQFYKVVKEDPKLEEIYVSIHFIIY